MITVINIVLTLLGLGMIMVWATYGLFSGFIHLMIVIASGVLAFAMWEPISYMLLGTMPQYAHGVGLLAPFAISLIVLRVVFDKFCRMNVHVPALADQIGGGVFGLLSFMLAFGVLLNGVFFMPLDLRGMGYTPQSVEINGVKREKGGIWQSAQTHVWADWFFTLVADGSMRPISGPSLADARPNVAQRSVAYSNLDDPHVMRSAHPDGVKVVGVYAVPATEEGVRALVERSTLFAFLKPTYEVPAKKNFGDSGMGLVNAVLRDLRNRFDDDEKYGKPSDVLNLAVIQDVARTPELKFDNPTSAENFELFLQTVTDKLTEDMLSKMKSQLGEGKNLWMIDTFWKNDYPGTYNTDGSLRVPQSQVHLLARGPKGKRLISPVGFSIQYNKNTGARTFRMTNDTSTAYSPNTDLNLGWAFVVPDTLEPKYFYCRELRFDLSDMEVPDGATSSVNQNFGAFAFVMGALPLPRPAADDQPGTGGGNQTLISGVQIAATGVYADLSEALPGAFAAAATSMDLDENATPWTLEAGKDDSLARGRGGQKNTVREVQVASGKRLVRVKLDGDGATSLLGRARELAAALNTLTVSSEAGNEYNAIGYAKLNSDGTMAVDIRGSGVAQGGLSASELPDVAKGETLMVYFEVPISAKKIVSYNLGSTKQEFETPLEITDKSK